MIYYDYEATRAGDARWMPLRNDFVIYHGENALDYWSGGHPADSVRGFLAGQSLQAGDVIGARESFVLNHDIADAIRIVRYDNNMQIIFSYELIIKEEN